jgi:hypothetical protein
MERTSNAGHVETGSANDANSQIPQMIGQWVADASARPTRFTDMAITLTQRALEVGSSYSQSFLCMCILSSQHIRIAGDWHQLLRMRVVV